MMIQRFSTVNRVAICVAILVACTGLATGNPAGEPYITMNQVNETTVGDLVIVSGTTDLKEGTQLFVTVEKGGYNTGGVVLTGENGIHRWSVPLDTSGIRSGTYQVNVTEVAAFDLKKPGFIFGNASAVSLLTLTGPYLGSDKSVPVTGQENCFISLDPVRNRSRGDQFLATGRTNLQVGTDIIWDLNPVNLWEMTTGNATGSMANSQVFRGSGTNRIAYAVDTTLLNPGEYNLTASTIRGEIFNETMVRGPVSDSVTFMLQ
jgi:hypothetical protein